LKKQPLVFGSGKHCSALKKQPLLCIGSNDMGKWKEHYKIQVTGGTAQSRFFCFI